jgi:alanyl-tRNA synthetase
MTSRAYYEDAYTTEFVATVLEQVDHEGQPAAILDKSYFYPTSGGQPHDLGTLDGVPVLDVIERQADDFVLHITERPLTRAEVLGKIDWQRRFDHMQQHTGQHILSQAFHRVARAETTGFHLSREYSTIDLAKTSLPDSELLATEDLANQVVWEDHRVKVRFELPGDLDRLVMRMEPSLERERWRLVEIDEFDLSACGGTHVATTGAVGMVKIVGVEKRGPDTRVTFLCGDRALRDFQAKSQTIRDLMGRLTTGQDELSTSVERMLQELKAAQKRVRSLENQLLTDEAERLRAHAERVYDLSIIRALFEEREPVSLRQLASQLISRGKAVALLGSYGRKSHLVFARSQTAQGDMSELIQRAFNHLGTGRGGGEPGFAQGGGPAAGQERIERALDLARDEVIGALQQE